MTTTQGQRQEKTQLVARVEKYKLEEEMAVLSSSVYLYFACAKKVNTGCFYGEATVVAWLNLGNVKKCKKKNVEQTKIWAYGKQLELKKGLEVLNYEGIVHFFLGAQCD